MSEVAKCFVIAVGITISIWLMVYGLRGLIMDCPDKYCKVYNLNLTLEELDLIIDSLDLHDEEYGIDFANEALLKKLQDLRGDRMQKKEE